MKGKMCETYPSLMNKHCETSTILPYLKMEEEANITHNFFTSSSPPLMGSVNHGDVLDNDLPGEIVDQQPLGMGSKLLNGCELWKCKVCGQDMKHKTKLLRHLKTHFQNTPIQEEITNITAKRSYQCPLCENGYSQKYNLKRHLKSCHKVAQDDLSMYCLGEQDGVSLGMRSSIPISKNLAVGPTINDLDSYIHSEATEDGNQIADNIDIFNESSEVDEKGKVADLLRSEDTNVVKNARVMSSTSHMYNNHYSYDNLFSSDPMLGNTDTDNVHTMGFSSISSNSIADSSTRVAALSTDTESHSSKDITNNVWKKNMSVATNAPPKQTENISSSMKYSSIAPPKTKAPEEDSLCPFCAKQLATKWSLKRHIDKMHHIIVDGRETNPVPKITEFQLVKETKPVKSGYRSILPAMSHTCPICQKGLYGLNGKKVSLRGHLREVHMVDVFGNVQPARTEVSPGT